MAFGQVTQRRSVGTTGVQGNDDAACISMTPDARYVAFTSGSSNLVPGDSNNLWDVFLRDRRLGTTERVSVTSTGLEGDGASYDGWLSADGRFVSFTSLAGNMVPNDSNATYDAFVRDRHSGLTERISVGPNGVEGNADSYAAPISADGRYVLFSSFASNLVAGGASGQQVYVRDRLSGVTEIISVDSQGNQGNGFSFAASISADGRHVAFASEASNLVPGDGNGNPDVFVRDRMAGTTERVSVDSNGVEAAYTSEPDAQISADGRYVVFVTDAPNLVVGDTNQKADVFIHDRRAGTTERVSVDSSGVQCDGDCYYPRVSADGRFIVFSSWAGNLVSGDSNNMLDVFVRDRQSGSTERASIGAGGVEGDNGSASGQEPSADGRYVAFSSFATNLVPDDLNARDDVFLRDRYDGTTFTDLCSPGIDGVASCPCGNPPSTAGRGCENSSGTGGAVLSASGGAFLSSDSLVFVTRGETPTGLSMLTQWTGVNASGVTFGMGVRCTSGTFRRLYAKQAVAGSMTAPSFGMGDQQVSVRSASLGDVIVAGQSRWYLVYYRDSMVLGGCPPTSTFNATQTGRIAWWP
ncbi:MAG TPA: hypothetical protein VGR31_06260 [Planctomycetota bacterium]|nr:hypothetical protein [Planctomycetota bacterium]